MADAYRPLRSSWCARPTRIASSRRCSRRRNARARAVCALCLQRRDRARARAARASRCRARSGCNGGATCSSGARRRRGAANPVAAALLDTSCATACRSQLLIDLIEARSFDLYDDPMPTLAALEAYAAQDLVGADRLAARILRRRDARHRRGSAARRHRLCHRRTAARVSAACRARASSIVPLDLLERHGARAEDMSAGHATRRAARGAGRDARRGAAAIS